MTTGSLVKGLVDGMEGNQEAAQRPSINWVAGNPDGVLTAEVSGLAIDAENGMYYMNDDGDTTWITVGSTT